MCLLAAKRRHKRSLAFRTGVVDTLIIDHFSAARPLAI
jgi:hypothetical protein